MTTKTGFFLARSNGRVFITGNSDRLSDDIDTQYIYNCTDCVTTYEISDKLDAVLHKFDLYDQYLFQMRRLWPAVLAMMERGIKVDVVKWEKAGIYLDEQAAVRAERLDRLLPDTIWPRAGKKAQWYDSPAQMKEILYDTFGQKPIRNFKAKGPTTNDAALTTIGKREPLLKPMLDCLLEYRKCKTYRSNFLNTELEADGRLRCTFNIAVAETLRLVSSENCFRRGTNLQNLPVDIIDESEEETA